LSFATGVLYRKDEEGAKEKAESMDTKLAEMCAAYGHSIVNEFPVEKYLDQKARGNRSWASRS